MQTRLSCFRRFRVYVFSPFSPFFAFSLFSPFSPVSPFSGFRVFVFTGRFLPCARFRAFTCSVLAFSCYGMDCFGTYFTHAQSCDNVHVQRATEWIAFSPFSIFRRFRVFVFSRFRAWRFRVFVFRRRHPRGWDTDFMCTGCFTGPKFLTRLPAKTSFLGGHCCGRSAGPIAFDCKRARLFASEALSRLG